VDPRTQSRRPGSNWTYDRELFALARRLGHDLADLPRLRTALTHRSALSHQTAGGGEATAGATREHNSRLSFLGKNLVQYFVTEHLLRVYPHMEAEGLGDVCKFLLNDSALAKCADHLGITDLIRSQKRLDDPGQQKVIVRALVATVSCIHLDRGPAAARKFVTEFVTSKMAGVDLHEVIKLQHPRHVLRSILASRDLPGAESRLLKETGRATHFPTFVVGVYSGDRQLGEGCGTSLKRAEREAIVAALHQHFATQLASLSVPEEGYEKEGDIDFFQPISSGNEPL
jgi:large subunit ribosomal protein L44